MPIRKELRKFYGREWIKVTRPRILARAGHKCERCQAPNYTVVARWPKTRPGWWFEIDSGQAHDETGALQPNLVRASESPDDVYFVKIVLTIAHLNHVPGADSDDNLQALCQRCHLKHDREEHKETRAARKDRGRPILAAIEEQNQPCQKN
jgi:5-methylcytosine-specific restriction endonuclease McrA